MSIISSNHRLVKVNSTEYSAGSGIDITNNIISLEPNLSAVIDGKLDISSFSSYSATIDEELQYVSANAGNTYSAGDNIDIYEQNNDLYISAKDWTTDIANASSYAFNEATAQIPPAFDPTYISGQIDNKLNKSDFETYSGSVNTQISGLSGEFQTTSSLLDNKITAVRNDLNTVSTNTGYLHTDIQTTSGILSAAIDYVSANVGDEFPASANEAITAYQTYSGTYLTAHQDISNKLDTTAFSTVSGTFLTAHQDLSNYATTGDLNNASSTLSGAIDYISGVTITAHQDLSYISGQVDNKLDTTAFSNVSSTFLTAHQIIPSAKWEEASTEYEKNSGTYLTAHQDISNKLDTTAFSTVSGTFLTAVDLTPYYTTADANTLSSMLSGAIDYVSANAGDEFPISADQAIKYVQTNSSNIDETVTSYQTNSSTYLTAHQDLSYISGQIDNKLDLTAFNIPASGSWNESTNVVQNNSAAWFDNVGDAEVNNFVYDNSATINDVNTSYIQNSGTYLTAHQDLSYISGQIDNKADISLVENVSGNITAMIPSTAGLATTAEVNTISSILSGAVDYVSANAGGASGYVSGENYVVVDGPGLSSFCLTNISGDVQVVTGKIYNGGSYITSGVISLSSLQGQVNNKLNSSDIDGTKTLSYYDDHYEVGGISYKPDGFSGISATTIYFGSNNFTIDYHTYNPNNLYSAKIVVEASNYGNINGDGWEFKGYENGSATYAKYFKLGNTRDYVNGYGFSNLTNIEASAVSYSALSIESLAFKSDLTGGGGGDVEVNDYVYNNSATIDDAVLTYQTNSASYLTAHQDISANEWNSVYNTVEANSGSWTGGGGSIDTIPFVVQTPLVTGFTGDSAYIGLDNTAINLSAYVPYSAITDDYGDSTVHYINGSAIYASTANWSNNCNYANVAECDSYGNTITNYYEPKLTIAGTDGTITAINSSAIGGTMTAAFELSAGAGISIVDDLVESATVISVTAAGGNPEVESYVQSNSASIDDAVLTYQSNSSTYLTSHQAISANEWNSNYDTVTTNSGAWGGSALPISAGPGISLSMIDGVLVISVTGVN